jgi:transposase
MKLWFEHFLKNIGQARPQVLILDGHSSHNSIELLQIAKANDIILVELPEHTSHWLQPLDR